MPSARKRSEKIRDVANPRYRAAAPIYLLDVNVLIALLDPEHVHHARAHAWFRREVAMWASCALTQNGTLRIMTHPSYTNPMDCVADAVALLARLCAGGNHRFWPCDDSLLDSPRLDTGHLLRHAQITDTYLLTLAAKHRGKLATFDRRLVTTAVKNGDAALHVIE